MTDMPPPTLKLLGDRAVTRAHIERLTREIEDHQAAAEGARQLRDHHAAMLEGDRA